MSELIWPVIEFRPMEKWMAKWSNGFKSAPIYRFNGGDWTLDDGQYDLAFACLEGPPVCIYVALPYRKNILWSWLTAHWRDPGPLTHPQHGSASPNPWHYMLRPGTKDWGGDWGRDRHENTRAGDAGMSWVSSKQGCANGRPVEFHLGDPHINAGLVRYRDTKDIITFPEKPMCMYCDAALHAEGVR